MSRVFAEFRPAFTSILLAGRFDLAIGGPNGPANAREARSSATRLPRPSARPPLLLHPLLLHALLLEHLLLALLLLHNLLLALLLHHLLLTLLLLDALLLKHLLLALLLLQLLLALLLLDALLLEHLLLTLLLLDALLLQHLLLTLLLLQLLLTLLLLALLLLLELELALLLLLGALLLQLLLAKLLLLQLLLPLLLLPLLLLLQQLLLLQLALLLLLQLARRLPRTDAGLGQRRSRGRPACWLADGAGALAGLACRRALHNVAWAAGLSTDLAGGRQALDASGLTRADARLCHRRSNGRRAGPTPGLTSGTTRKRIVRTAADAGLARLSNAASRQTDTRSTRLETLAADRLADHAGASARLTRG